MKKVTDKFKLRDMIINGKDISKVDYSDITDTSNVTYMRYMFYVCTNLEYLESPQDFDSRYFSKEENPLIYKNYLEMFL